ncbi:hypothetical protein C9439_06480 [archaeon SCG-AAA382B04]|nr:hypothetical protein C9439_06480 [archaeon SCG-AAA382B04]
MNNTKISIGIYLPNREVDKEQIKKLIKIKDWLDNLKLSKLIIALPNVSNKIKEDLENLISGLDVEFIYQDGKSNFLASIKDLLKEIDNKSDSEVNEDLISQKISKLGDLDIIVKFGQKKVPSNFILEKSYSELFFVDEISEFNEKSFSEIIKEFQERDRRFGA